jgi:hypothetical protein
MFVVKVVFARAKNAQPIWCMHTSIVLDRRRKKTVSTYCNAVLHNLGLHAHPTSTPVDGMQHDCRRVRAMQGPAAVQVRERLPRVVGHVQDVLMEHVDNGRDISAVALAHERAHRCNGQSGLVDCE